jgi:hypothetical protein
MLITIIAVGTYRTMCRLKTLCDESCKPLQHETSTQRCVCLCVIVCACVSHSLSLTIDATE